MPGSKIMTSLYPDQLVGHEEEVVVVTLAPTDVNDERRGEIFPDVMYAEL